MHFPADIELGMCQTVYTTKNHVYNDVFNTTVN